MDGIGTLIALADFVYSVPAAFWNWLHLVSDFLIALSYLSVLTALLYFTRRRRRLPLHWALAYFCVFLVACGLTYAFEVWSAWHGHHWSSGVVKAGTALVSMVGAILLIRAFPAILESPLPDELSKVNQALRAQATALRDQAALLDLMPDGVIVFDMQRRILFWNHGAEEMYGFPRPEALGKNVFDMLAAELPQPIEYIESEILKNDYWEGEATHYTREGKPLVVATRCALQRDDDGTPLRILNANTDITLRRLAEQALLQAQGKLKAQVDEQTAELHHTNAKLMVQYGVTSVLADSPTFTEATPRILQAVCEAIGWQVAEFWRADPQGRVIECSGVWHSPEFPLEEFEQISRHSSFAPGIELPGRVWHSGEPVWISDIRQDSNFTRAASAQDIGLRSAFAVPIRTLKETIGAMEFFSSKKQEVDEDLLELISVIGSQVGQFIERKQTEDALREQEAMLRSITETASDAIVTTNAQGKIVFFNLAAERIYGYSAREAIGKAFTLLIPERLKPDYRRGMGLELVGRRVELVGRRKDGSEFPFELSLAAWENKGEMFYTGILRDITERKWAEESLRQSEERFRSLSDSSPVGIFQTDANGYFLYTNLRWQEMSGLTLLESLGEGWRRAIHSEDRETAVAEWSRRIGLESEFTREFRFVAPDGTVRWVRSQTAPVTAEDGKITGYVGTTEDMTERKRAEEALERSRREQMQLKDEFLSHVSHELRSPLAAILQFTSILADGLAGEVNAEQLEYLHIALRNCKQLQTMIDDLLEVTRAETGKLSVDLQWVYIFHAITDTVETLQGSAAAKEITLTADVPAGMPPAYADPARIRQVLINLIHNAIKFTPEKGEVRVRARVFDNDSKFLLIEVSDTGCGLSSEAAERIFERLYQVAEPSEAGRKGLGLGLYICKELVARQGGKIWVKSRPQEGSTFYFTLPIVSMTELVAPPLAKQNTSNHGDSAA